ncbi:MAG: DUF6252 family protein [Chitinophagales bacterium]
MKSKIVLITVLFFSLFMFSNCSNSASCTDGIQNQGERGIDCGDDAGLCPACSDCTNGIKDGGEEGIDCGGPNCDPCETAVASCTDGIQNQGEEGIDCGGPCTACDPIIIGGDAAMTATIDTVAFVATSVVAVVVEPLVSITGNAGDIGIALSYSGTLETGTFDLASATMTQDVISCTSTSGTITFSSVDTDNQLLSGSFEFDCNDILGGTGDHSITSGTFENVSF